MEECDMRLGEIKKTSYEFERDLVKGAVNPRTNKVVAEKVVRYFEDKIRARVRKMCFCLSCNSINLLGIAKVFEVDENKLIKANSMIFS